ncbi:unnamed protein product [Ectocarpus sp. 8 AP-2014]
MYSERSSICSYGHVLCVSRCVVSLSTQRVMDQRMMLSITGYSPVDLLLGERLVRGGRDFGHQTATSHPICWSRAHRGGGGEGRRTFRSQQWPRGGVAVAAVVRGLGACFPRAGHSPMLALIGGVLTATTEFV